MCVILETNNSRRRSISCGPAATHTPATHQRNDTYLTARLFVNGHLQHLLLPWRRQRRRMRREGSWETDRETERERERHSALSLSLALTRGAPIWTCEDQSVVQQNRPSSVQPRRFSLCTSWTPRGAEEVKDSS